ncbi:MAG TPA: hypothetical protein VGJ02_05835 [Pyrinomonadaceae bacterium]|jgi:hypothetical protein
MAVIIEEVKALIERLPPETTIEDLQYHLYVMDKVRTGFESIEREGGLTQEQVEERLSKWLNP